MTKEGGECVAPASQSGPAHTATTSSTGTPTTGTDTGQKTPYDKDTVDMVLNRASNQVKTNCGAATDENGKAIGPWGTVKVTVTLGRNGHMRGVDVHGQFADKPVGNCVVHAFQNVIFPPYAAPADVPVDLSIEVTRPPGT